MLKDSRRRANLMSPTVKAVVQSHAIIHRRRFSPYFGVRKVFYQKSKAKSTATILHCIHVLYRRKCYKATVMHHHERSICKKDKISFFFFHFISSPEAIFAHTTLSWFQPAAASWSWGWIITFCNGWKKRFTRRQNSVKRKIHKTIFNAMGGKRKNRILLIIRVCIKST